MPITSTSGVLSTGRDCTIVLIGPFGRVDLPNVTGFDATQNTASIHVDRLDGTQLTAELPKGWTGSLECDRGNNALDLMIGTMESAWMDTGQYANSTMFQYVLEADGSTTTFAYDSVSLKSDPGRWAPDQAVRQRISFRANRRRIV